jgi:hypothetical protein
MTQSQRPAPKAKTERDPTEWGEYWKNEFRMLKLRRGLNQVESYSSSELEELMVEMTQECLKPPYNEIERVIIQRVVSDAVLSDQEFFGFTVAWVRKVLNKWWFQSGWKLIEKKQREKEAQQEASKPVPEINPHLDVQVMVSNYVNSLLKKVPDLSKEEIQKEGQERKKEKALSSTFNVDHVKNYQINLQHEINRLAIEGYAHVMPKDKVDFKTYVVEGIYKVHCASMQDAEEIYRVAKERMM